MFHPDAEHSEVVCSVTSDVILVTGVKLIRDILS